MKNQYISAASRKKYLEKARFERSVAFLSALSTIGRSVKNIVYFPVRLIAKVRRKKRRISKRKSGVELANCVTA